MHSVPVILFRTDLDHSMSGAVRLHEFISAATVLQPNPSRRVSVLGMHGSGIINGSFVSSVSDVVRALDGVEAHELPRAGEQMSGSLTVYVWDAKAQRVTVLADPLGASLVFMHTDQGGTAISSSIGNLAEMRERQGKPLRKSLAFGLSALVTGGPGLISSSYEGVELLDHFHYVEVDQDGVHVRSYRARDAFYGEPLDYDEGLRHVENEVRNNVRVAAGAGHSHRIAQLTGGMDSRTVLGALLREGLEGAFAFNCMGDARTPDKAMAHGLATEFDLTMTEYSGLSPYRRPESYNEQVLASLRFSGGLQSTPVHNDMRHSQALVLAGGYGELLRSPYRAGDKPLVSTTDARALGEAIWGPVGFGTDSRRLISDELQERYLSSIRELSAEAVDLGLAPDAWQDHYYVRRRNRFFVGEISRQWSTFVSRFDPLYSVSASRAMLRQPWQVRKSGVFQFDLMARLHPTLPKLPFDTLRHNDLYKTLRATPDEQSFTQGKAPRYNDWSNPHPLNQGREFTVNPTPDQIAQAKKLRTPVQQVVLLPTVRRETQSMLGALSPEDRDSTFDMETIRLLGNRAERHGWSLRSLFVIHSVLLWYLDGQPVG